MHPLCTHLTKVKKNMIKIEFQLSIYLLCYWENNSKSYCCLHTSQYNCNKFKCDCNKFKVAIQVLLQVLTTLQSKCHFHPWQCCSLSVASPLPSPLPSTATMHCHRSLRSTQIILQTYGKGHSGKGRWQPFRHLQHAKTWPFPPLELT